MTLTHKQIESLQPKAKPYRKTDSGGLCIEVSPTGGKLWRWRYKFNGKSQLASLGKFPLISLQKARELRDEVKLIKESGKHPTRFKKAQKLKQATEGGNTFKVIAERWLEEKGKRLNQKYHTQTIARMRQHVFPAIGNLPLTEITVPDIVKVVDRIADRGTLETAKRMGQMIGQVFRYATRRGLCLHNPAADMRGLVATPQEKHHPCISPVEAPALLQAIDNYGGGDFSKAAMKLMALTFVRTQELIGAKWDEIDWQRQEWHIPASRMKMKRPHCVPLSKQAVMILKEIQELTGDKEFIFFSAASKLKHMSNGSILMALRRMGYQGRMTGHGFRTLASTILNEKGYSRDAIERQLSHEDSDKIRSAYNRAEYMTERKKLMQDYADILDRLKEGIDFDNVIQFGRQNV
ncbi:MAG: tyrosine-type recombinase/integrase [Alphaproteobacteria bacterium]|nr:tyrosine-type recombinase/integrase [Alphaproteobacteria bacterium]